MQPFCSIGADAGTISHVNALIKARRMIPHGLGNGSLELMERRGTLCWLAAVAALLFAGCGEQPAASRSASSAKPSPAIWNPTGKLKPLSVRKAPVTRLKITAVNSIRETPVFDSFENSLGVGETENQAAPQDGPSLSASEIPDSSAVVESQTPDLSEALKRELANVQKPASPAPSMLRSPQMDIVAQQAEEHVRTGWRLAERGAILSARSEFIQALRKIAQAWDALSSSNDHSQALVAGLRALEEAEDLIPRGANLEGNLDTTKIIAGHSTPVLHGETNVIEVVALQKYYGYAWEQLARASHGERAASLALFGLGRIHTAAAQESAPIIFDANGKAAAFHQGALAVDPDNFMSANELAVIAAKHGQYESARDLLLSSIRVAPQATAWQNLAQVHRTLGELQLADAAMMEAKNAIARNGQESGPGNVKWVGTEQFAATSRPSLEMRSTQPATSAPAQQPQTPKMTKAHIRNSAR